MLRALKGFVSGLSKIYLFLCLSFDAFIRFLRYFGFLVRYQIIILSFSFFRLVVRWNFYSDYVQMDAVDNMDAVRTENSSTYRTANSIRTYCSSPGNERERRWKRRSRIKGERMGHERNIRTGDRSDRVLWKLAKRFVPPRAVPTELVCNSILSATKRREGGCCEVECWCNGVLRREKVHLPLSRWGAIGFECLT